MADPENKRPTNTEKLITQLAHELGFALVGFSDASPSTHPQEFKNWIAANKHGEMHYLQNHQSLRLDPSQLLPGAQSIICFADAYPPSSPDHPDTPSPHTGQIARYAWGNDYHKTIKKRLFPNCRPPQSPSPQPRFQMHHRYRPFA